MLERFCTNMFARNSPREVKLRLWNESCQGGPIHPSEKLEAGLILNVWQEVVCNLHGHFSPIVGGEEVLIDTLSYPGIQVLMTGEIWEVRGNGGWLLSYNGALTAFQPAKNVPSKHTKLFPLSVWSYKSLLQNSAYRPGNQHITISGSSED